MSILLFYLLLSLTADGIMLFLTAVIVYILTGNVQYSGLSYAIWWMPRLILIPIIGKLIDKVGIRPLSIISDLIKILSCIFLIISDINNPLSIAISFGIVGSLISIGNSQILINYEKIIAIVSESKEKHINIMSRMDFLGMIIGSLIGMLIIDMGYKKLLIIPIFLYTLNAIFFYITKIKFTENKDNIKKTSIKNENHRSLNFIYSSPLIIATIGISIGNNMFDGLIESTGATIIDDIMELPVKYFGFIDISAGLFGVIGTYVYSNLLARVNRNTTLLVGLAIIIIPSILLVYKIDNFIVFLLCYSITIIGKVIIINICRITRIEEIPTKNLASTSSIIVLLNQLILPIVGGYLFFFGKDSLSYMLVISILISLFFGLILFKLKNNPKN